MKFSRYIFTAVALVALVCCGVARAAGYTVFVEPVEVFNSAEAKELAPGLRSMVASRISGQGYSVTTDSGAKASALFSLRTTLTRLGGMYSMDAELTTSAAGLDGARAYETVPDLDSLAKGMEKITDRMRYRLWQVAVARGDAKAEKNDAPPLDRHPPPSPVYQPLPPIAPPQSAPVISAEKGKGPADALSNYKDEGRIDGEVTALASADLDGDGLIELVVLAGREMIIFRETAKGLEQIWTGKPDVDFKPIWVSAGDVDRDRTVEILLAGSSGPEAYTQVFTWRNNSLVKKGGSVYAFLRAIDHPEQGMQVYGLKSAGGVEVFRPGLRVYRWTGTEWADGPKVPMPDYIWTLNIQWLHFGQTPTALFVLDRERKIRIYDEKNEKLYTTDRNFQGTRARIEGETRDERRSEPGDIWEIEPSAIMWTAGDGQTYAIFHANVEPAIVSNRWGYYDNGSLLALRWDGLALHSAGESPKFPGFFAATARGATASNGRGKLYAALVKSEGTIFRSYKTTILSFDL